MRRIFTAVLLTFLIFCILSPISASSQDCGFLLPKYIHAGGEYHPAYDAELAEFLRKCSSDAYTIYKTEEAPNMEAMGFEDITWSYHEDESVFYEVLGSGDEMVRMTVPLETNFVTGAKEVTVGGVTHKVVIVSFRGTVFTELSDVLSDIMVFDAFGFHAGFICAAQAAYNYLSTSVSYDESIKMSFAEVLEASGDPESNCHILVTGHSLGAAVANLFTSKFLNEATDNRLNTLCYTYACPLVCSDLRSALLDGSNIINIINTLDVVPYIGYQLKKGTRPGLEVSDAVVEELGDIADSHKINNGYKELLKIIDRDVAGHYSELYRSTSDEGIIHTQSGDDYQNVYIPEETLHRFTGLDFVVHGQYALKDNIEYPFRKFTVRGGWVTADADNVTLPCDLIIESGEFTLGAGNITVEGDLRLQVPVSSGGFTGGSGHLIMRDDGYMLVKGDAWFQGGDTNYLYMRDMIAGTLEVKGDFSVLASTEGQAEMVFCPAGDHRVVLSGSTRQTVYFDPYISETSYPIAYFAHLEVTNPLPLYAPNPISLQYLDSDLSFEGDLRISPYGDMIVSEECTLKADNVILDGSAHPEITGKLTVDGDLSGGRLDIGEYGGEAAHVKITGSMRGTDLYFTSTNEPSTVQICGDYLNDGADIVLCNGSLKIGGSFLHRVKLAGNSFGPAPNPFASIYEGSCIEVDGNFILQMQSDASFGLSENCDFILKGNFVQITDSSYENFWNYGLGNLILAGSDEQIINAPMFYFDDLTLANTSNAGVVFEHKLFGISGVFNAYGRPDGSITPYRFPQGCAPAWADEDLDGVPDCLDPEPFASGEFESVPAVIGAGTKTESGVKFLYAASDSGAAESSVVWAAIYRGGMLTDLRPLTLNSQTGEIHELEIEIEEVSGADMIRIFQICPDALSLLWNAASWQETK